MTFFGQTQVVNQPNQAVAGDRASQNPMATFDAGPGGLVADSNGVIVGNFCWVKPPSDPNGTNQLATQVNGYGNVAGFLYNDLQALNTIFLSAAGMTIPQGLPVALAIQGDFWVVNNGTTEAAVGMKAYASFGTGAVSFAATGAPLAAASATGSTVTLGSSQIVGSIAGDVLTVTAVNSGTLYAGTTLTGTGIATGTQIASQLSGTTGGVGTYTLTVSQQKAIASETINGTYGILTIGTLTTTTPFAVGQTLTASGSIGSGVSITANISGTGGTGGTMVLNSSVGATSQTISSASTVETKWYAASAGGPGQYVKMTSWVGSQG